MSPVFYINIQKERLPGLQEYCTFNEFLEGILEIPNLDSAPRQHDLCCLPQTTPAHSSTLAQPAGVSQSGACGLAVGSSVMGMSSGGNPPPKSQSLRARPVFISSLGNVRVYRSSGPTCWMFTLSFHLFCCSVHFSVVSEGV